MDFEESMSEAGELLQKKKKKRGDSGKGATTI
jgi:hypothetical protein